jgi:choline dehydrogenase-like flavoprotein
VLVDGNRAVGVEFEQLGARRIVKARREVVLCGGAINSPQLLMLSGIGDRDQLAGYGIDAPGWHMPDGQRRRQRGRPRAAGARRGWAAYRGRDAMPTIIRGHTHAPSVLIGEKAADLILS